MSMDQFRFLNWGVYRDAQELFSLTLKFVKKLPKEYRFELGSQIIRSSFSVVLNIAEGSGKSTDKELNRYLNISLGSLYEVLASIDILRRNDLLMDSEWIDVMERVRRISSQLGGFKKKLIRRES